MAEFEIPSFLLNCSADEIHAKMQKILPADIDISQGSHEWDMTYPTALALAEMCEYILPQVLMTVLPEWSYGSYADAHARARGITRRAATAATGEITLKGEPETTVPAGSLFSTESTSDTPSVDFATLNGVKIGASGTVTVAVECTETGTAGNVMAGMVIFNSSNITGITGVTNEEEITGGTEAESDESLKERIADHDLSQGEAYVGCPADYKRWAKEVAGVGDPVVIPAEDDSGLVQIVVTDTNGDAATESLCEQVYNHIMRPDQPEQRKAPVGANLSVIPPNTIEVGIQATLELKSGYSIEIVQTAFLTAVTAYLAQAMDEKEIKRTRIGTIISGLDGVNDYADLQIGIVTGGAVDYGTSNIPISRIELPHIAAENITFSAGTVE